MASNPKTDSETKKTLAEQCVEICESQKAENILLFDVSKHSILADYYLICTGTSHPHIRAICNELHHELGQKGITPQGREGVPVSQWIVLDYGNVIIHIMDSERREYYRIEELWNQDEIIYRGGNAPLQKKQIQSEADQDEPVKWFYREDEEPNPS